MSKLGTLAEWRGANTGTYVNAAALAAVAPTPPPPPASIFSFCKATISGTPTFAIGAQVNFNIVSEDTAGYSQGAGVFKVPETGVYLITVRITDAPPGGSPTLALDYYLQQNGIPVAHAIGLPQAAVTNTLSITTIVAPAANALFRIDNGSSGSITANGQVTDYEFSIVRLK